MRLALLLLPALLLAGCAQSPQEPAATTNEPAPQATPTSADAGPQNPTMSLASAGALHDGRKTYTVSSTSEGLRVRHLALLINSASWTYATDSDACADHARLPAGTWAACINDQGALTPESPISAGHQLVLAGVAEGQDLRVTYQPTGQGLVALKIR